MLVTGIKGMAIVSGYDHPMYSGLKWKKVQSDFMTQKKSVKTETLWLSPATVARQSQLELSL